MASFLLTGVARWALVAALSAGVIGWVASGELDNFVGGAISKNARENAAKEAHKVGKHAGDTAERAGKAVSGLPSAAAQKAQEYRSSILGAIWGAIRLPLLVAALLVGVVVGSRLRARRRRIYARYHVRPYESDTGRTASITDTWDEIQHAILHRWWRRLWRGQPSLAAEIHNIRSPGTGVWEQRLVVAVIDEERVIDNVEAALRSTYEHVRFERIGTDQAPPWLDYVVRLKRARSFVEGRLATPVFTADGEEAQQEFCIDRLVSAMERMQVPATVQLLLTPTPAGFERMAHWWLRRHEEERLEEIGAGGAGTRSTVTQEELEGAAEGIAHRPLFFGEIRVASTEREVAEQLATVIQGSTRRGENKLVRRFVRVRRDLYARRLRQGEGNPVPSFLRGVYATAEIAAIYRLPNPFRNAGRVTAHSIPRLRPDPAIRRVPASEGMVVVDEGVDEHAQRGLALWPEDNRANLGILGTVNAGKTTALIRAGLTLARDTNRALFFIDPKEDGWWRFLAALETERPVYVIDCAKPEAGFSPLQGSMPVEKRVEAVEQGVLEMHRTESGEVQMYAPSRAALNVSSEISMRFLENPRFDDIATLLSVTAAGYEARAWALKALTSDHRGSQQGFSALTEELQELLAQLEDAKGAFTQRLAAPRNKITRLRVDPMRDVLQHPVQVDIARAIEERAIVVVNGAQGQIGAEPMRGLISMFLVLLLSSVLRQQGLPEGERADVSLILDEAHFFLGNEYLKEGLATARSAGLASILAFQHLGQLDRDQGLRALTALVGSWLFFRIAPEDAAAVANLMQPAHTNTHNLSDDVLERLSVNPRALSAAPRFSAIGTFIVNGDRSPPFSAKVEKVAESEAQAAMNLQGQRGRIGARRIQPADKEDPVVRPWEGRSAAEKEEEVSKGPGERRAAKTARKPPANQLSLADGETSVDQGAVAKAEAAPAAGEATPSGNGAEADVAPPEATPAEGSEAEAAEGAAPVEAAHAGSNGAAGEAAEEIAVTAPHPIPANLRAPPTAYTELDRYAKVTDIRWDEIPEAASPRQAGPQGWKIVEGTPQPDVTQLEVMRMLWDLGFMGQFQIARRFYSSRQTATRRMNQLYQWGLVERFVVATRQSGRDPAIYRLARPGFELLKLTTSARGAYLSADQEWKEDQTVIARQPGAGLAEVNWQAQKKRSAVRIAHDLEAISWALAFEDLAAPCIKGFLGRRFSYQMPPAHRIRERGQKDEYIAKTASEIQGLPGRTLCGLDFQFGTVNPDVAFEIEIAGAERERRFDILVEYERTPTRNKRYREKLQHYDALITAWWRENRRYRDFDEPPALLFVVPDWETAYKHAQTADEVMLGGIGKGSWSPSRYIYEGRRRIFFTAAPFVYQRTTLAYSLQQLPPMVRGELTSNKRARDAAVAPQPGAVVEFPPRKVLKDPARIEAPAVPA